MRLILNFNYHTPGERMKTIVVMGLGLGFWGAVGCSSPAKNDPLQVPVTYHFESRFGSEASVSYSGQSFRHVLMLDLTQRIDGLTTRIDDGTLTPTTGQVVAELNFYFDFDGDTAGGEAHGVRTDPQVKQTAYQDIASGKNLVGKLAGNDVKGQHKDWASALVGWQAPGVNTPESLILHWFEAVEALALDRVGPNPPKGPNNQVIKEAYISPEGLDYKQLVQKFLGGAIAYSQGADDYLDDDLEGKGLRSDNVAAVEGKGYSELEHAWDEGFGYFGAARDYSEYTDDEAAGKGGRSGWSEGYHDTDADGRIDLLTEYNFGHAVNAAKRDRDSSVATDFSGSAMKALIEGRHIIASAQGALSAEQMDKLIDARNRALQAWESAIGATVVHYINEVLVDMGKFDTADYSFEDHAKHWSELKGFALAFQFSRFSSLTDAEFVELHRKIGQAPVLPGQSGVEDYKEELLAARQLLADSFKFAPENLGDENGVNGW